MTRTELLGLMAKAAPGVVAGERLEELSSEERNALVSILQVELARPISVYRWRPSRAYLVRRRDRSTGRWISS